MPIQQLPDDLIDTAFTYLNSVQLYRCLRTSYRWRTIASNPYLICQLPHVDGVAKEQIMYNMISKDTNNLEYLLSLSTPIMKRLNINKRTWCISAHATWSTIQGFALAAAEHCGSTVQEVKNALSHSELGQVCKVTRYEHWGAFSKIDNWEACVGNLNNYLGLLARGSKALRGLKAHQAAECMVMLSLEREVYQDFMAVEKELIAARYIAEIPEKHLDELSNNPWIKQYVELFK